MRGDPEKTELSSRVGVPCSIGFPHYMSVLGTQLYQCTSWCCERLSLASVNFSEDSFNAFAHFMIYECTCSHHAEHSAVLDPKWHDPHAPPSVLIWSCPEQHFCFPRWKVLKGRCFANADEVKQKVRSTKRHQNWGIRKLFWTVEKTSW